MQTTEPISPTDGRRARLASLLLARQSRVMPRFLAAYARLRAMPRGYRRRLQRRVAVTAAGAALILAMAGSPLFVPSVRAATITVDETTCTLIDAIIAANTDTATGGCDAGAGPDTIDLQADVLLTQSFGYYYYSDTGLPLVTSEIVIEGNGHTIERDTADTDEFRILAVNSDGDLTLHDVTISGGSSALNGGGVYNYEGAVAINNSTLSGNSAVNYGGGIHTEDGSVTISAGTFTGNSAIANEGGAVAQYYGTMTISDSTFTGNTAPDDGGAIVNYYGTMTITGSTFSGNTADYGGAIYNDDQLTIIDSTFSGNEANRGGAIFSRDPLTITGSTFDDNYAAFHGGAVNNLSFMEITNSTISGNEADFDGGGIYNHYGELTVTNSTITGNTAGDDGGGIYNFHEASVTLSRSLISGNIAPVGREINNQNYGGTDSGTIVAGDFNVFGFDGDAGMYNFAPAATDVVPGAGVLLADILITTLADNGGPTQTHLLMAGSPALDLAPSVDCAAAPVDGVDQRGAPRNVDVPGVGSDTTNLCDTGAVEGTVSTAGAGVFMSTTAAGTTGDGLAFGPHDILEWDGTEWSKFFDGSAAGLMPTGNAKHNVNAFWIPDTSGEDVVMSFAQNTRVVPGIVPKVDGMDLVWWDGDAFSLWFDGQDVGLTVLTSEKIDGLHVLDGDESPIGGSCDAYLLISTQGPGKVPNFGGGTLNFRGEDILGFCATNLGANTAGFWHMALDGSEQDMPANATDSISLSADGNTLYLTTRGVFNVDSAIGGHSMVYEYDLTSEEFSGPIFIAADNGLPKKVDGLQVE